MNESLLLKLSLIFSLIGIIILYLISNKIQINDITIEKINKEELQKSVKIKGRITDTINKEKITILKVLQENEIKVVLFDNNVNFTNGELVEIEGKIDEFNDKKQIVANYVKTKKT
jgi:DNA/RNA endonuclease YhcR with UshA esterase domain